jgi:hypothetical protein
MAVCDSCLRQSTIKRINTSGRKLTAKPAQLNSQTCNVGEGSRFISQAAEVPLNLPDQPSGG